MAKRSGRRAALETSRDENILQPPGCASRSPRRLGVSRLARVTCDAERLQVVAIPKECGITMMRRDVVNVLGHGNPLDTQAFYTERRILEHLLAQRTPAGGVIPVPTRGIPLLFSVQAMGLTVGTIRHPLVRTGTHAARTTPSHRHPVILPRVSPPPGGRPARRPRDPPSTHPPPGGRPRGRRERMPSPVGRTRRETGSTRPRSGARGDDGPPGG